MNDEPGLTLRANTDDVVDGINALLNLFTLINQPLFPRNIMTASYSGAFTVNSEREMYNAFRQADYHDCRISAYPPVRDDARLTPNLVLLDIDFDESYIKDSDQTFQGFLAADEANKALVSKIIDRLHSKFKLTNLMLIHTGNGRHILVPFIFERPFEYVKEMQPLVNMSMSAYRQTSNNIISENFLSFAKKYLSDDHADKANYPKFSNMFLRVPGTLNWKLKYGMAHTVKIERECQSDKEKTLPNFGDVFWGSDLISKFHSQMCLQAVEEKDRNKQYSRQSGKRSNSIAWIETLHTMAVTDCRKRIIRLIFAPYTINIKKMLPQDAFTWIQQWAEKCNQANPFDSGYNIDQQIEYMISKAEDIGYFPISRKKIELDREAWKMKGGIYLDEFIENKMMRSRRIVV
jgi:hypothetical protein